METGTLFGGKRCRTGQRPPNVDHIDRLGHRIADRPPAIGGGQIEPIGDGAAKIGSSGQPGQSILDAEQTAHIAGVTIGIPATGIDDHQRFLKVIIAVQQGMDNQRVVRHHMTVTTILVIAIVGGDLFPRFAPIRLFGVPVAHVTNQPIDDRIFGDEGDRGIEQLVEITLDKGLRLHRGHHLRAIDRFAIVADE